MNDLPGLLHACAAQEVGHLAALSGSGRSASSIYSASSMYSRMHTYICERLSLQSKLSADTFFCSSIFRVRVCFYPHKVCFPLTSLSSSCCCYQPSRQQHHEQMTRGFFHLLQSTEQPSFPILGPTGCTAWA